MDYVDLVFWMGLFLGIIIVLLVLGLLSYLKPSSNKPIEVPLHPFNYNNGGFHQLNLKLDQLLNPKLNPFSDQYEPTRESKLEQLLNPKSPRKRFHCHKDQTICKAAYQFAKDLIWNQGIHALSHPVRVNGVDYVVSLAKAKDSPHQQAVVVDLSHLSEQQLNQVTEHIKRVFNAGTDTGKIVPVSPYDFANPDTVQPDLKASLHKAGLDQLEPVANASLADLDGDYIYGDADGRKIFSPTTVNIDGVANPVLVGRSYYVEINPLRHVDIEFQAGNPAVHGVNGLTNELLLTIIIHRLAILDAEVPCPENKRALDCLETALDSFQKRAKSRILKKDHALAEVLTDGLDKEAHHR